MNLVLCFIYTYVIDTNIGKYLLSPILIMLNLHVAYAFLWQIYYMLVYLTGILAVIDNIKKADTLFEILPFFILASLS